MVSPLTGNLGGSETEIASVDSPKGFGPLRFRNFVSTLAFACGLFLFVFGLGWIPGLHPDVGNLGRLGTSAGATYLFAIGIGFWIWGGRAEARRVIRVSVSATGLFLRRVDGTAFEAHWEDPSLAIAVTDWRLGPAIPLSLGVQFGDSRSNARITRDGFARLRAEAESRGFRPDTVTKGTPPRDWTITTFRRT
jgi:hypothetical protein